MRPMRTTALLVVVSALVLGACTPPSDEATLQTTQLALLDGTPEGIGVLDFLNDPSTTLAVLDDEVPLNKRTAENLVDALAEGPLNTIAAVDAVPWVGPAALNQLVSYATTQGWVPTGADPLGTWDGVTFTVDEATDTLALANTATLSELDDDLGLDKRAATSIVDAQPIASVAHLASLYYVGTSALNALLDASSTTAAPPPYDDQFNYDEAVDIPDGLNAGIDTQVNVAGVPNQPVDVNVIIDLNHEALGEIAITLTSPNGDTVAIPVTGSTIVEPVWIQGSPNGTWTLNVVDGIPGFSGELMGWAIEVISQ